MRSRLSLLTIEGRLARHLAAPLPTPPGIRLGASQFFHRGRFESFDCPEADPL